MPVHSVRQALSTLCRTSLPPASIIHQKPFGRFLGRLFRQVLPALSDILPTFRLHIPTFRLHIPTNPARVGDYRGDQPTQTSVYLLSKILTKPPRRPVAQSLVRVVNAIYGTFWRRAVRALARPVCTPLPEPRPRPPNSYPSFPNSYPNPPRTRVRPSPRPFIPFCPKLSVLKV